MATLLTFTTHIRKLIAQDDFDKAIKELCALLKDSPHLDEAILHSARYNDITRQIRLGVVDFEAANLTKNQIRVAVLDLLSELEDLSLSEVQIKNEIEKHLQITGNQNIIIQNVNDSTITFTVNGQEEKILRKLDDLQVFLEKAQAQSVQVADKQYAPNAFTSANFNFIVQQANYSKVLPKELSENLVSHDEGWHISLKQALIKQKVSVGNRPTEIFQHYGWLIETFLQKMSTSIGKENTLRALSFMTETYQSSLRYLCFIQVAQLLQNHVSQSSTLLKGFLTLNTTKYHNFDYLNLLIVSTELIPPNEAFVEEIYDFAQKLSDTKHDLYGVALFLDKTRNELASYSPIAEDKLVQLMDEYRTALVYWLREIAFLAKYRLVSIKDINLNYRLGTAKNFVHAYGELHGIYESAALGDDYTTYSVEDIYTYNHSILLFKGTEIASCLERMYKERNYISLSPLLIDQSVFSEKNKQTPEIYYYTGMNARQYHFAQYKNEFPLDEKSNVLSSNKGLIVKMQNNQQPKLDELFEHLEQILQPYTKS